MPLGGFFGGITHPLLDGVMHADIEPLRPFARGNPFLGLLALGPLHMACILCGVLGLVIFLARADGQNR